MRLMGWWDDDPTTLPITPLAPSPYTLNTPYALNTLNRPFIYPLPSNNNVFFFRENSIIAEKTHRLYTLVLHAS